MNEIEQQIPPHMQMEEVHLQDYLNVLFRRRKTFLAAFVAVFAGVALYTFLMKPIYQASATLHVKDEKQGKSELLDLMLSNDSDTVDSEIEILKSRTNAEKVVKELHLNWRIVGRPDNVSFRMLDFDSSEKKPVYTVELTGNGSYTVRNNDDELVGKGQSGRLMIGKGMSLLLTDIKGEKGDSFGLKLLPFNKTVKDLRDNVNASEVGKKTNIISLTYTNTDPVMARNVVNTLVQAYLEQNVGFKAEEASKTVGFVENQLQSIRNELDKAEQKLESYKSTSGVVMLDETATKLIDKLSDTEKDCTGVTLRKKSVEFALASLKEARLRGRTYSPVASQDDPVIAGLASQLADLQVKKSALLSDSTEQHPAVQAIDMQIDEVQKKLQATYESELRTLAGTETGISRDMDRYEGMLKGLPASERDLAKLTRLAKVDSDIYTFLLQKHEEAKINEASTISNINIVDPAITPELPVKPQKGKNLLLGLLVGCMFGVGLAFFQEYLDDTIKDADGAKRELKWPLLAVTPQIRKTDPGDEKNRRASLLTHLEPKSQAAEAFRSLRTGIHFTSVNRKRQVILMTSTFPGEGKSTVSANLGCILSQTGANIILIDCDLRKSTLHEKLGCTKEPGLTDHLAGDAPLENIIRETPIPDLHFISAGLTPPNPAELLGSQKMLDMIATLRESFDTIIIDAPPVLAVTDAPLLTSLADMVLVVIEAGRVPIKAARQMRETLVSVNAPVAGIILNDKSGKGREHYGYGLYGGKYYGYYGYGYGYYQESEEKPKAGLRRLLRL